SRPSAGWWARWCWPAPLMIPPFPTRSSPPRDRPSGPRRAARRSSGASRDRRRAGGRGTPLGWKRCSDYNGRDRRLRPAFGHRARLGEGGEVLLRLLDVLGQGALQPKARFAGLGRACGAGGEIAAQHQLGIAMALLGGGAEPALGGLPVHRRLMA